MHNRSRGVGYMMWTVVAIFSAFSSLCRAQSPPFSNDSSVTIRSPVNQNITIQFKSPPVGTCTTVFSTQKQYTGYINLPSDVLRPSQGNFSINTFFWFIEARQEPEYAPFTVFINGGPGSSSMVGLFQEVGPCQVVELDQTHLGTVAREWGWDRSSNILFIDQPVQVGFSYDVLTNASLNLLDETLIIPPQTAPQTQPSYTFLNGTFGSNNPAASTNTSQNAAQSMWHFLQGFFSVFPQYNPAIRPGKPGSTDLAGINLFTESYGGKYGPAIFNFFEQQNQLRQTDPVFANSTLALTVSSLGIMNGWVDLLTQTPFHPRFAYNNTFQFQAISQVQQYNALSAFNGANGCQQQTSACRAQEGSLDPKGSGNVDYVNSLCSQAEAYCQQYVVGPYSTSGRSVYDISQTSLNPFPDSYYLEYLNQIEVQQAIGAPVNYSQDSLAVFQAFEQTGDYARDGILEDLVTLLNSGVRVALIYGDRDYICNWLGGEAVSFAIAGAAGATYSPWYSAGYTPIVTNNSYVGGVVREYGNLSFSRVYDAGHLVPAYQPETAFTIFSRVIEGTGVSLGLPVDLRSYSSHGDANATHTNSLPAAASPTCFLRATNATCDTDQKNMLANRAGVIFNGVLYDSASDWQPPDSVVGSIAGQPNSAPASMMTSAPVSQSTPTITSGTSHKTGKSSSTTTTTGVPTGVFTATGVPSSTSSSFAAATGLFRHEFLALSDTQPAAMMALGLMSYGILYV